MANEQEMLGRNHFLAWLPFTSEGVNPSLHTAEYALKEMTSAPFLTTYSPSHVYSEVMRGLQLCSVVEVGMLGMRIIVTTFTQYWRDNSPQPSVAAVHDAIENVHNTLHNTQNYKEAI